MNRIPEELDEALARMVLRQRMDSLTEELVRLKRRPDEESIHDTRVQSRRMRAALEAFKDLFPPHPWSALYGLVRQVTKALGKARETEVSLSLLKEQTGSGDMAENLCREYLEQRFRSKLQKRKRKLKRSLREINSRQLRSKTQFLLSNLGPFDDLERPLAKVRRRPTQRVLLNSACFRCRSSRPEEAGVSWQNSRLPFFRSGRVTISPGPPISDCTNCESTPRSSVTDSRSSVRRFPPGWTRRSRSPERCRTPVVTTTTGAVLRETLQVEIRRLTKQETTHLAFQLGRLLSQAEDPEDGAAQEDAARPDPASGRIEGVASKRKNRRAVPVETESNSKGGGMSLRLYIVRHAIAVPHGTQGVAENDRPLTPDGIQKMKKAAAGMKELGIEPHTILSSPLPRAWQTAEIIAKILGSKINLKELQALSPSGKRPDVYKAIQTFENEDELMLVGHQPSLGEIAGEIAWGSAESLR